LDNYSNVGKKICILITIGVIFGLLTLNCTNKVMLKLPSDPKNIAVAEAFLDKMVKKYRVSPDLYGNMLVSLTEAVTNAIIHGNRNDCSKTVDIDMRRCTEGIAIRVSDQGRGFDYRTIPDPTAPENRCKCGGRGVFLMQKLCDNIKFDDNGRTVEMKFKL
jgi:serine/threonine-protein kinase RsbW